jgi:hypothetical protein
MLVPVGKGIFRYSEQKYKTVALMLTIQVFNKEFNNFSHSLLFSLPVEVHIIHK